MLTAGHTGMAEEWQNANLPAVSTSLPYLNSELHYAASNSRPLGRTVANPAERQVGFWSRENQRNGFVESLHRNLPPSDANVPYPHDTSASPKVPDQGSGWSLGSLDWPYNEADDGSDTVLHSLASLDDEYKTAQESLSNSWSGTSSFSGDHSKYFPPHSIRKAVLSPAISKSNSDDLKLAEKASSFPNAQDSDDFSSTFPERFAEKLNIVESPPEVSKQPKKDQNQLGALPDVPRTQPSASEKLPDIDCILPDDEDLMAGMIGFDGVSQKYESTEDPDDTEDVFISGGGLELETETFEKPILGFRGIESLAIPMAPLPAVPGGQGTLAGEHPFGEHPSRTLFVRNINSNVEDSELRALFEQYGDIRTLYTACKHRGFVMISYYDIRAARSAMRALQNKPLRRRKLDIHFSIPKENPSDKDINQGTLVVFNLDSSVSNEDLRSIFGAYGEVKEIRETPHKKHHKFIEFYDVRAADAALKALNRSDIAGKRIKLEPSRPGGARRSLIQQLTAELEQEESRPQRPLSTNSPPLNPSPWNSFPPLSMDPSSVPISKALQPSSFDSSLGNHFSNPNRSLMPNSLTQTQTTSNNLVGATGLPPYPSSSLRKFSSSSSLSNLQNQIDQTNGLNSVFSSSVGSNLEVGIFQGQYGTIGINRSLSEKSSSDNLIKASSMNNIEGYFDSFYENNGTLSNHLSNQRSINTTSSSNLSSFSHIWNSHVFPSSLPSSSSPWSSSLDPFILSKSPSHHSSHSSDPFSQGSRNYTPFHAYNPSPSLYSHVVGSDPQLFNRYSLLSESPEISHLRGSSLNSMGSNHGYSIATNINGYINNNGTNPSHTNANLLQHAHDNSIENYSISQVRGFSQGSFNDTVGIDSVNSHSPNVVIPSGLRGRIFSSNAIVNSVQFGSSENFAERGRGKRNESVYPDSKKQYALDLDKIMSGEDTRTTLMIKNIPNKYTQKMLLSAIDENHRGNYDFFYLPIDFKNKCNVGYAFINMIEPIKIIPFYEAFNGKKWEKFNSEKVASLAYARIQGKQALVAHFQNSSLMNEDKRCRPVLFHTQGPLQGDQEPFPVGMNVRSRPSRDRLPNGMNGETTHHGSPSNLSCSSRDDSGHGGNYFITQTNANMVASFLRSSQDFSFKWKEDELNSEL